MVVVFPVETSVCDLGGGVSAREKTSVCDLGAGVFSAALLP